MTPWSRNDGTWTTIYCGPEADDPNCEYATPDGCNDPPPCRDYPVQDSTSAGRSRAR